MAIGKRNLYFCFKRAMDLLFSALGLTLLSPLFLLLGLMIKIDSPGPVFFRQRRIGRQLTDFHIIKFRTMRTDAPKDLPTHQLADPGRYITRLGRFLRKTSLDELPQLWNILTGSMSFIGPRPALWNQDDLIAARGRYGANAVLPGLTGLAQVMGRDELPIEDKARLDGEYVQKIGFLMDVACLIKTVRCVLKHEGVIEGGTGTLEVKGPK